MLKQTWRPFCLFFGSNQFQFLQRGNRTTYVLSQEARSGILIPTFIYPTNSSSSSFLKSSQEDLKKIIPLDQEKKDISKIETSLLVEYVKQIISYLIKSKLKLETRVSEFYKPEKECLNEYEG